MNKKIKKQFWLTKDENDKFQKKAEECCLNEATLFRKMIEEFEPKTIPKEFHDDMNKITEFITNLREIQISMISTCLLVR